MPENDDIKFMGRCLDLAAAAEGLTYPNPLVGSVIVYKGRIIGEGFHLKAGEAHAEVNAINSVQDREVLKKATLYVNLEPCSHFGKTPPCADLIIERGIRKVVSGTTDTSREVSGRGIEKLKNAGCEVTTGVLEKECRYINRRFFTFHEKKRPYIILKWAQSPDGYIDIRREKDQPVGPYWITGDAERSLVHRWRAAEQAILAGGATIRSDNPKLNIRDWAGKDPLRLILSSSGQIKEESSVFKANGANIVFTHNSDSEFGNAERVLLEPSSESAVQIVKHLFMRGIQSVIIEGGAMTLNHFISTGLWDEARIFTGRKVFGSGVKAPVVRGNLNYRIVFSNSILESFDKGVTDM